MTYTVTREPKPKRITANLHAADGALLGRARLLCRKSPNNAREWQGTFQVMGTVNASDFLGRFEYQIRRPNKRPVSIHATDVSVSRQVNMPISVTGDFVGRDKPPRSIFG